MNAGKLDRRITLREVSVVPNSFGEPAETFSDLATVWANVKEKSGKEIFVSGTKQAQKEVLFSIRYRTDVTTGMQVVFEGDTYDIESYNEIQRRKGLELYCKRQQG